MNESNNPPAGSDGKTRADEARPVTTLATLNPRTGSRRGTPALLPSLFARLADDHPSEPTEDPSAYTLTPDGLREQMRRELALLLGTTNLENEIDLEDFPEVARSGLNYGMPPLAGIAAGPAQGDEIAKRIRQAIVRFVPRLREDSLVVRLVEEETRRSHRRPGGQGRAVATADADAGRHLLRFEILAEIEAEPYPLEFMVQSSFDPLSQRLSLVDRR